MLKIIPDQNKSLLLNLGDGQLQVNVAFERLDEDFTDNVYLSLCETCPPDWKLLSADEVSFGMTSAEARRLAQVSR
jgi:hypothetical protein